MNIDILIEVYEYAPYGHGDVCSIDDFIDAKLSIFQQTIGFVAKFNLILCL